MLLRGGEAVTALTAMRIMEAGGPDAARVEKVDADHLAAAIGAEYFEIYHRRVGPLMRDYLVICDDAGRIKSRTPTAVTADGTVAFVGDILVCRERCHDIASIDEEDAAYLHSCLVECEWDGKTLIALEVDR